MAIPEGWQRLAPALRTIVRVRPGAAPVVSVHGELDIACASAFEDLVLEVIIRHGPDVVIDASGLSFCDARGLGALVRCANEARRSGGRLTLADPDRRLAGCCGSSTSTTLCDRHHIYRRFTRKHAIAPKHRCGSDVAARCSTLSTAGR
ncbi:hypothetical protein GCM10029978_105220 [Actinoallomurus acanthiterrae]